MAFFVIIGLIVGSMWIYFRFFGKTPCPCEEKK